MTSGNDRGLIVTIINKATGGKYQTFDLADYASLKLLNADVDRSLNLWERATSGVTFGLRSAPKFGAA